MPWAVELVGEVDSTNRMLVDRARAGAPAGTVLVADHQTAGRGRLGRTWLAPPGSSLLVSALLRPAVGAVDLHLVTMAVALATLETVRSVVDAPVALKWPNDVLVGRPERKVGGILCEAVVERGGVAVVVGLGLNLNWPDELPEELATTAIALNHVGGKVIDRTEVLARWLDELERRSADLSAVLDDYRAACATVGRHVTVELTDATLAGLATGIDDDGRLLVETAAGEVLPVAAGDVVHVRPI